MNISQLPLLSIVIIGIGEDFKHFYIKNMNKFISLYSNIHYYIMEKDFIE